MNDIATTAQDIPGSMPMEAISAALEAHGAVRLAIAGMQPRVERTPRPISMSDEMRMTQVLVIDSGRQIAETVGRCVAQGHQDRTGIYAALDAAAIADLPILHMEMGADGVYAVSEVHEEMDPLQNPFLRVHDLSEADFERLLDNELSRRLDPSESVFESMMKPRLRDFGITVIECRDERASLLADVAVMAIEDRPGYDYRSINERWNSRQGRRRSSSRRR